MRQWEEKIRTIRLDVHWPNACAPLQKKEHRLPFLCSLHDASENPRNSASPSDVCRMYVATNVKLRRRPIGLSSFYVGVKLSLAAASTLGLG